MASLQHSYAEIQPQVQLAADKAHDAFVDWLTGFWVLHPDALTEEEARLTVADHTPSVGEVAEQLPVELQSRFWQMVVERYLTEELTKAGG